MRKFGSYESVQEVFRGGLGSVFSARRAGAGGEPAHAVKTCEPVREIVGDAAADAAVEQFFGAAEVQRAASAAAGAEGHWAPVHEADRTEYGAYYVTDLFERGSLERLSLGLVKMDARSLHRLMSGVAAGLAELERSAGRPHGNLRLTNILISGSGGLETARVVLSDPLSPSAVVPERDRAEDLRALGRAMYQAVFHQSLREGTVLPLPPAAPWQALGKAGEGWRELCSRLLEPEKGGAPLTLEGAIAELERLGAIRSGGGKKGLIVAGAAAVVLLGVGGALLLMRPAPKPASEIEVPLLTSADFDEDKWRYVARAAYTWFNDFERSVGDRDLRAVLGRDPHVEQLIKGLENARQAGRPFSPERFPGLRGTRLQDLAISEEVPGEAMTGEAVTATAFAARVISGIEEGLKAGAWPALAELQGAAEAFEDRGWGRAAGLLKERISAAAPGSGQTELSVAVRRVVEVAAAVRAIQASWAQVEAAGPQIAAVNDAVLARFTDWARSHALAGEAAVGAADAPLAELGRRVEAASKLAGRLREFVKVGGEWETIDQEEFWSRSEVHRAGADRAADAKLFEDWLFEVASFRALDPALDPRRGWEGAPRELVEAKEIGAAVTAFRARKGSADEPEDVRAKQDLERLSAQAAELAGLRWSTANRGRIEAETPRLVSSAADLRGRLDRRLTDLRAEEIRTFTEAETRLRARDSVTASRALNELWRSRRDALLAEVKGAAGGGDAAVLGSRSRALEGEIVALEEAIPSAELPAELAGRPWSGALAAAAADQREGVIGAGVRSLEPRASLAGVGGVIAEGVRAELSKLEALARDAVRLEELLAGGYGLSEAAPGGETVGAVHERLRGSLGEHGAALQQAMAGLLDRVAQLGAIAAGSDREQLAGQVRAARIDAPEQALGAWRRLGELSWPRDLGELERELELRESLGRVLGSLRDAQRREQLGAELASEGLTRFERMASGLRAAEEMEAALGRLGDLGLAPTSLRHSGLRFNVMLLELRRELGREGADEERAKALTADFVARVRRDLGELLGADAGAQGVVEALEGELARAADESAAPRRPRVDVATLGPGSLGPPWQAEVRGDGAEVVYRRDVPVARGRPPETLELRFVRVPTGDGPSGPTGVYLLANEVSLGQFIAIVESSRRRGEMEELLRKEDDRSGPTVWAADSQGIRAAQYWTPVFPLISQLRPMYPAELRPDDLEDGPDPAPNRRYNEIHSAQGVPGPEMPMQQLPIQAAMYCARLAGCRLPTAAEWRAALGAHGGVGDLQSWNLRDATWAKQQRHIAAIRDRGGVVGGIQSFTWPDRSSFALAVVGANVAAERQAESHPFDDKRLWFAPAIGDATEGFSNLIGNVAEFVFDEPAGLEALPLENAMAFESFADRNIAKVGVIGGSSLSAPGLSLEEPLRPKADEAAQGFADVGVRLAFTADGTMGPERFSTAALRAAAVTGYVLAP